MGKRPKKYINSPICLGKPSLLWPFYCCFARRDLACAVGGAWRVEVSREVPDAPGIGNKTSRVRSWAVSLVASPPPSRQCAPAPLPFPQPPWSAAHTLDIPFPVPIGHPFGSGVHPPTSLPISPTTTPHWPGSRTSSSPYQHSCICVWVRSLRCSWPRLGTCVGRSEQQAWPVLGPRSPSTLHGRACATCLQTYPCISPRGRTIASCPRAIQEPGQDAETSRHA